jgi:formamidopyrimidine-DNA glycosylase
MGVFHPLPKVDGQAMFSPMPELPEVETVCRGLALALEGRRLTHARTYRADLRRPFPPAFAERLQGRRVDKITRRAKYLTLLLDDGWVWIAHLGMSGRMLVGPADANPPGKHDHLIVETEEGQRVTYNDARRFGLMDLCPRTDLTNHPLFAALGPEPLDDSFTPKILATALGKRSGPIKTALLDQSLVAGIGNIYASEALFRAGIAPDRSAATVSLKETNRLVAAIKAVLIAAIAAGGSSLRDHRRTDGELGYFQHSFAVYDREGLPCPNCDCAEGVRRLVQSGRSTFYCAKRQR